MLHSTQDNCAPKVQRNGHSFPLAVHGDSGKWSSEIGGETRLYFELEADPTGELSLRLYKAERLAHDTNTGRVNGSSNGRKPGRPKKLKKPLPDLPLFIHQGTGRWCKKIGGKHHYFGYVESDPDGIEAEKLYRHDLPYLECAEQPPEYVPDVVEYADGLTLEDLADEFLTEKDELLLQGELSRRSYADCRRTCERLLELLGKHRTIESLTHRDFRGVRNTLSQTLKHVALGNELQRMRTIFKYGFDNGLLDTPVNFGTGFKKPKAKHIRKHRNQQKRENGLRMFAAEELRMILDAIEGNEVTLLEPDENGKPVKVKPIIDLMPIVGSVTDVDEQEAVFRLLGYRCWGEYSIAGRRYLTLDDPDTGKRRFQLHCYEPGSEEIDRHLAFRDYLRANPRKAQEYENEKRRCQQLHPNNSRAYADAKSEWIQDQLPAALASFRSSR